jgi:hypothetical protein
MTTLYCAEGHERPTERMQPQRHELTCLECGRGMSTFKKQRSEIRSVSDKRMEAEGDQLTERRSTLRSRSLKVYSTKEFHDAVVDLSGCALAYLGGCWGRLEAHHHVPKQRIKRALAKAPKKVLLAALNDPRNGVCGCTFHHGQVEAKKLEFPAPPYLDEFLEEFGLTEAGRLAA